MMGSVWTWWDSCIHDGANVDTTWSVFTDRVIVDMMGHSRHDRVIINVVGSWWTCQGHCKHNRVIANMVGSWWT